MINLVKAAYHAAAIAIVIFVTAVVVGAWFAWKQGVEEWKMRTRAIEEES